MIPNLVGLCYSFIAQSVIYEISCNKCPASCDGQTYSHIHQYNVHKRISEHERDLPPYPMDPLTLQLTSQFQLTTLG